MSKRRQEAMRAMLRPIAHRGLHNAHAQIVENTLSAFSAAIEAGVAVECDLQCAADSDAVVFHDFALDRLTARSGPVAALETSELTATGIAGSGGDRIPTLAALLDLVEGAVPLFIEIKSDWRTPDEAFIARICECVAAYRGPAALMSFDPDVIARVRAIAPNILRGIVSCQFTAADDRAGMLSPERRSALSNLLENANAEPDFLNYRVSDLSAPIVRYVHRVQRLPVLAWTVRTEDDLAAARTGADAPVFEDLPPTLVAQRFSS